MTLVDRFRRRDRRLGGDRERPSAVARLRRVAHRRCDIARAGAQACSARWRCSSSVYGIVFSMGIYYINRLINKGPEGRGARRAEGLPKRPLSGAEGAARDAIGQEGEPMEWYLPVIWAALIGT